jgi:hypothetical protein
VSYHGKIQSLVDCIFIVFGGPTISKKAFRSAVAVRPSAVLHTLKILKAVNPLFARYTIFEDGIHQVSHYDEYGIPICLLEAIFH